MSMDVNSAKNLIATTSSDSIYGLDVAAQKAKLKTLFSQSYSNDGEVARGIINPEIERLNKKIAELEKVLTDLIEKAEKNRVIVEAKTADLSDIIMKIDDANEQFLKGQKNSVDASVTSAMKDYESGVIGKAEISVRIQYYISQNSPDLEASKIQSLFTQYNMSQLDLKGKISDAATIIDENNLIRTQMGTTKATLSLLTKTRDNMGTAAGAYKNIDTQATHPIYTPQKEALVDGYLEKYTSRLLDANDNTVKEGVVHATPEQRAALADQIKAQYSVEKTSGVDPYSASNAQLVSLGKALNGDNNIIQQMDAAGFSKKEIIDTITQIFPSVGVAHQTDGSYTLPYGHGTEGAAIYTKLLNSMNNYKGVQPNPNLTAAGNPQLKELGVAIKDGILNQMKAQGFTFKETFFALQKLFPGVDLGFTLGSTTLKLPTGDDKEANDIYKQIADSVGQNHPGATVVPQPGTYVPPGTTPGTTPGTPGTTPGTPGTPGVVTPPPKRTDPVGFAVGNTTYEFMVDRNGDGKMGDESEFIGANGVDGIEELLALHDKDGDGIIKGEELDKLMLLRTNHDNLDYGFISASAAGIKELDLNSFKKKPDPKGDDFINVNDALKAGTFNVTLTNGQKAEGYQKFETQQYMNTVYQQAFGRNLVSKLSDQTVNTEIDKAFSEVDNKLKNVQHIIDAVVSAFDNDDEITKRWATFSANKHEVEGYRNQKTAEATGVMKNAITQKDELEEQ